MQPNDLLNEITNLKLMEQILMAAPATAQFIRYTDNSTSIIVSMESLMIAGNTLGLVRTLLAADQPMGDCSEVNASTES